MNNLLVHRSHPQPQKGLTTTSPAIIDDKEQTPMCGPWRWRIPKLRIAPAVRSLYLRLRGRTSVTMLRPSDNDCDISVGQKSLSRRSTNVELLSPVAFSTSSSMCLQPSTCSNHNSPIASSSPVSGIRDVSTPSRFSLPSAVGESEVFATDKTDTSQSNSNHLIYQHVGKSRNNGKAALDAACEINLNDSEIDKESTRNSESDRDLIFQGESEDTRSKDKVHHPVDILVITHSPSASPISETDSYVDINIQENDLNVDEVWQPRPFSRMGRECWEEREPKIPFPVEGDLAGEKGTDIGSSEDFIKSDNTDNCEIPWVKREETEDDSELDEELDYYEDNDEEGDDYLDMDKVLRKCPPTEVLQNLRDMVQLSKNTSSQLEKALRRAARISCGPFPRLPGSGLTKTEVIDLKCTKLVGESEDFLGEINKNFLTFYTVLEQMDNVSAQQDSFVSSIMVKRGPRDWRMGHAAPQRKMDKLWSRDYPKVITRKLKGSIQETIYEEDGE